jgi:hypothetical protein
MLISSLKIWKLLRNLKATSNCILGFPGPTKYIKHSAVKHYIMEKMEFSSNIMTGTMNSVFVEFEWFFGCGLVIF